MITLVNGGIQNASSIFIPNGSISFQLNVDATPVASPFGFVTAGVPVVFQFDADGNILPNAPATAATIWSNAELNPQNEIGLGTYYLVCLYDQAGARVNEVPMWWQFPQAANTTVDISRMVPFATIGGNVIFYPVSFFITAPTPTVLGGVFSNAGAPNQFVTAINTNGSVSLAQPSFANLSGQISSAQIPSGLVFGATTFSGLVTAQAGVEVGVVGTTAGQITLDGATSGQATITAPAVAGTPANPILFSNGINIPATAAYSINSGPTWTAGSGVPSSTPAIGSFYSNTTGGIGSSFYVYNGSAWVAVA